MFDDDAVQGDWLIAHYRSLFEYPPAFRCRYVAVTFGDMGSLWTTSVIWAVHYSRNIRQKSVVGSMHFHFFEVRVVIERGFNAQQFTDYPGPCFTRTSCITTYLYVLIKYMILHQLTLVLVHRAPSSSVMHPSSSTLSFRPTDAWFPVSSTLSQASVSLYSPSCIASPR